MNKRIILFFAAVILGCMATAQNTQRVVRVHSQGNVVFQLPTSQMDSIKSHNRIATFYFGDGTWSRNIHSIDSMTFAMVAVTDTTVIIDTTAIDTSAAIRIAWQGDSVAVVNPYAASGVTISCNGQNVAVTSAAGITNLVYELRGQSQNGYFQLNTDKKFILRLNGVNLTCEGKPAVNIKDSKKGVIHLVEGTTNTFADNGSNSGKACFYSKGELVVQGTGNMTVSSMSVNGLQGKDGVIFLGGNTTVGVSASSAKAIKTDGDVTIEAGTLNISASGSLIIDTLEDGTFDKSYSSGIKTDGAFVMNGGNVTIALPSTNNGGRCISTSGNTIVNGGYLTMTTAGAGSCLGGSGTNAADGYVCSCIKSDSNIYLNGGKISAVSTGLGGRGISADGHLYVGLDSTISDKLHVYVQTSGATVNATTSGWGGGGHGPGGSTGDDDFFKGIAKGIRIEGNIYIYGGRLQAYCSQSSGDPTGEAIESKDSIFIYGGDVEANAYDDAINAAKYLEVRGGRVWAYSRGNDGIDCNGNTNIYGGILLVKGNEVGIDAATDAGGRFSIYGGTIITQGGTMGAWDTPNGSSTQRWISISSANNGNNGLLVIDGNGDTLLVYKNSTFSGSGFINYDDAKVSLGKGNGTKPPPGGGGSSNGSIIFSCPNISQGANYTVYKSATITGGESWHGLYDGATASGSGTASTVRAN